MIFMGIDPGTVVTGYAFLLMNQGPLSVLDYGAIRPPREMPLLERYWVIYSSLKRLMEKHPPHVVAFETQFIGKNPQSGLKLGMARGAAIIAAREKTSKLLEFSPTKVKSAVTGNGRASKGQVQGMMMHLLKLAKLPEPEDAADALAIAYAATEKEGRCTPICMGR